MLMILGAQRRDRAEGPEPVGLLVRRVSRLPGAQRVRMCAGPAPYEVAGPNTFPAAQPAGRRRRRSRRGSAPSRRSGANDARTRGRAPGRRRPASSRSSRSAAISYSRFRVVPNIGGSSELIVTDTPASRTPRSGCSVERGDRPGGDVGRRAHLQRDAGLGEVGQQRGVLGGRRAVPDPLGAEQPQRVPDRLRARWSRRRAARECSPAARAASKCGWNCGRGTPISGPPSPKPTSASGRVVERVVAASRRRPAARPRRGCRRSSAAPARSRARRRPGRPRSPRCRPRSAMPARTHGGVRRAGQLGVPQLLAVGHLAGDLVGQQPHVLGRADQVDDREVDLDEVREVAELEELAAASSGSLGHACPGCRAASSATIRGEAEPTWWTCSSALGRPAMKSAEAHAAQSVSAAADDGSAPSSSSSPAVAVEQLAVDQDRRGAVDAGLRRRLGGRVPTQSLERQVLDAGRGRRPRRRRLDGQVDQLVVVGERSGLGRLVRVEQVVELLGDLRPDVSSTTANALAAAGSSRRSARGSRTAGSRRWTLPSVGQLRRAGRRSVCLELAAERAEEVLVDDDLVRRVGVADDQRRSRRWRRRAAVVRRLSSPGSTRRSRRRRSQHEHDAADHQRAWRCCASPWRSCSALRALARPGLALGLAALSSAVLREVFFAHRGRRRRRRGRRGRGGKSRSCPGPAGSAGQTPATGEAASRPTSRAISHGYFDGASAS